MIGRSWILVLAALAAFLPQWVFGLDQTILALLMKKDRRPTMVHVSAYAKHLGGIENNLEFRNQRKTPVLPFVDRLIHHGPKLIAALENTFPGATWAFVGRDTQLIGDLVEAFYISIGQMGRVVRIGSSKLTVANVDPDLVLKYLQTKGLDLKSVPENPPFIFVDTVSGGYSRQGRFFVSTVYQAYAREGRNPADLLRKVNMFGLAVSTTQGKITNFRNAPDFFSSERNRYLSGEVVNYFDEHRLLGFFEPEPLFNESGYDHFTFAWHQQYGPLVMDEAGGVRDTPGPSSNELTKGIILSSQMRIHSKVNEPRFLEWVQTESKALGYDFPMVRIEVAPEPEAERPKLSDEDQAPINDAVAIGAQMAPTGNIPLQLRQMVAGWPKPKEKKESPTLMTENGKMLLYWVNSWYQTAEVTLEVFRALRSGRKGLRLRSVDLKNITIATLKHSPPSMALALEASAFANESCAFRDMMENDTWIKMDSVAYPNFLKLKRLVELKRSGCAELLAELVPPV